MKFLVVDDHPIVRLGVRQLIVSAWPLAMIEEAETIEDATVCARRLSPDVIVLDLMLPDATGTEAAIRIAHVAGNTPILVLSASDETAFASRVLQLGITGYLPKDKAAEELVIALRRLLDGKRYVTPAMADQLVNMVGGRLTKSLPHELLGAQEHRVMLLIAAGVRPAQIAKTMHLSVKTIGTYRARIFEKTGWKNNVELIKYCVQHSLTNGS